MRVPFCPFLEGDDKMLAAKKRKKNIYIYTYITKNLKSLTYRTQQYLSALCKH